MSRNVELQTVSKVVSSTASGLTLGGAVASGMKRWVTFLSVDSLAAANTVSVRLYMASTASTAAKASIIATGNRKMLFDLRASKNLCLTPDGVPYQVPRQPNVDKPLFSIDGGKRLSVYSSNGTCNVFCQYYDE